MAALGITEVIYKYGISARKTAGETNSPQSHYAFLGGENKIVSTVVHGLSL